MHGPVVSTGLPLIRVKSHRFFSSAPLTTVHGKTNANAPSKIAPVITTIRVMANHCIWPDMVKTCERYWAGIPVGCSDFRVPLWKVRVLVICPYYLVGIHLACTVISGDIFRSLPTCIS